MTNRTKTIWSGLIAMSLVYQIGIVLLVAGHDATKYGVLDDQGRAFGFNAPITFGHIAVMLPNISVGRFLETLGWYSGCGLLAHLIGFVIIWTPQIHGGTRQSFFALQTILFPLGWFIPAWWLFISQFVGPLDGESIQDGPVSVGLSQVSWWLAAFVIFLWDLADAEFMKNGSTFQRCSV